MGRSRDIKGSISKFMVREESGFWSKSCWCISGSGNDFTLLSMQGTFTTKDLNLLAEKTNIPGMEPVW